MKKKSRFNLLVELAAFITVSILIFLLAYIFIKGLPHIDRDLFRLDYNSENLSAFSSIITTIYLVLMSLLLAVPLGLFTAIFLVEYVDPKSPLVKVIRLSIETLAGIPSIVYGLFGMLFFVSKLRLGYSLLAGSLTMVIMILPLIIRTSEEALLTVDNSLKEGSLALGASKVRTIFKVVLPAALPGILSGVILSIGRIVGETAALIYTLGTVAKLPTSIFDTGRTLSIHMYALSSEGLHMDQANATGVILILVVLFINFLSNYIFKKLKGD